MPSKCWSNDLNPVDRYTSNLFGDVVLYSGVRETLGGLLDMINPSGKGDNFDMVREVLCVAAEILGSANLRTEASRSKYPDFADLVGKALRLHQLLERVHGLPLAELFPREGQFESTLSEHARMAERLLGACHVDCHDADIWGADVKFVASHIRADMRCPPVSSEWQSTANTNVRFSFGDRQNISPRGAYVEADVKAEHGDKRSMSMGWKAALQTHGLVVEALREGSFTVRVGDQGKVIAFLVLLYALKCANGTIRQPLRVYVRLLCRTFGLNIMVFVRNLLFQVGTMPDRMVATCSAPWMGVSATMRGMRWGYEHCGSVIADVLEEESSKLCEARKRARPLAPKRATSPPRVKRFCDESRGCL